MNVSPLPSAPAAHPPTSPIQRGRDAFRAIRALIANPDDTAQVFRVIRALSGPAIERQLARFEATDVGRRVLADNRSLLAHLSDRSALARLPAGSLGHAYHTFTAEERISAQGLVDASMEVPPDASQSAARLLFAARLRDSHDLWHVVTGYGRDLVGEAALLAFTFRQTRNPGIGLIVLAAWWRAGRSLPGGRILIRDGWRRGGRAAWLPGADWEALLAQPLEAVRATLGVVPVGKYAAIRSPHGPAA